MKQYNVIVRFPIGRVINKVRVATPEDLNDISILTNRSNPPIRSKITNCMDLMKATALKEGLTKCFKESNTECEVFIKELSDELYKDLANLAEFNKEYRFIL